MTPRGWVWVVWTTGCAPFGPNVTGRWTGRCDSDPPGTITMELSEIDTDIEGEAVIAFAEASQATDWETEGYALLSGHRDGREIGMDWVPASNFVAYLELDGTVQGNLLEVTLISTVWGWPSPECTVRFDR